MACVIAAPTSGSGKTLLSLLLASWARNKGLKLQSFKVGPDYLDPQQMEAVTGRPCRNLDLVLSGPKWIKESFQGFGCNADLALIEGVMGLFDGIGSSSEGSTASIAKKLNLPVVLVIDAGRQAASIAALVKGFRDHEPNIEIAGVVINKVNTQRHKELLIDVLSSIEIKVLGCLPKKAELNIPSSRLGLEPPHELENLGTRIKQWASIAESQLDIEKFKSLLKPPSFSIDPIRKLMENKNYIKDFNLKSFPVAVALDQAFHFRYPETKECLEAFGMPLITWQPLKNEPIPIEAKGIIIPGGFPEQYAKRLSQCSISKKSLKNSFMKIPIYAECGGMLFLGNHLSDSNGEKHRMAGLLPFDSEKGKLEIGYRKLKAIKDNLILKDGETIFGHEFHYWKLTKSKNNHYLFKEKDEIISPWKSEGWNINAKEEGWSNSMLHASWIHLHWASSPHILNRWRSSLENN